MSNLTEAQVATLRRFKGQLGTKELARKLKLPRKRVEEELARLDATLPVWRGREARWWKVVAVLLVALTCHLGYSNNERAAYHYDDLSLLLDNEAIVHLRENTARKSRPEDSSLRRFRIFRDTLPETIETLYAYNKFRTLSYLTFSLNDYFQDGLRAQPTPEDPFTFRPHPAMHTVNNFIHLINGVLVFWVVYLSLTAPVFRESRRAARYPTIVAFLAAVVFSLHPMQTQAVTYLSQRSEALCATFFLLALGLYATARLRVYDADPPDDAKTDATPQAPWMTQAVLGGAAVLFGLLMVLSQQSEGFATGTALKLGVVLFLLAVAGVVALVKTGRDEWKHAAMTVGAFVSFGLALQCKEVAVAIPFVICLWELTFIPGRHTGKRSKLPFVVQALRGLDLRRLRYMGFWPLIVVAVLALLPVYGGTLVTKQVGATVKEGGWTQREITMADYVLTQASVVHTYVRSFALPTNLHLDYNYPRALTESGSPTATTILSILVILACVVLASWRGSRARVCAFALFFGLAVLAPSSSILVLPDLIYEHRFYLPLMGAALVLAVVVDRLVQKLVPERHQLNVLLGICLVACVGLMVATRMRNEVWDSDLTLWEDNTRKVPDKPRPWLNLGLAYQNREPQKVTLNDKGSTVIWGQVRELPGGLKIVQHTTLLSAQAYGPYMPKDIKSVEDYTGGPEQAKEYYDKALELDPNYPKALNNMATIAGHMRHNLIQENFHLMQIMQQLAEARTGVEIIKACTKRFNDNLKRAEELFTVAEDYMLRQRATGISNVVLYNNLINLYWQRAIVLIQLQGGPEIVKLLEHALWYSGKMPEDERPGVTWLVVADIYRVWGYVVHVEGGPEGKAQAKEHWKQSRRAYQSCLKIETNDKYRTHARRGIKKVESFLSKDVVPQAGGNPLTLGPESALPHPPGEHPGPGQQPPRPPGK